jgi:serine/threonine-protein kinase
MVDVIGRLNVALEGRYRVERELGEGGMATVFLADDLRHNRKVALKVLKPELAAVVGADRFLAEIETTAKLQHPHILPLFDSGEADTFLFYVMPYVEGDTLRDRLDQVKQFPVEEGVRIAIDMAEALDYAHRQGVVHRDIKPANVLIHEGRPLIADFGIALAVGAAGGARLTETGLSIGTPYYMSPEQATGDQAIGSASDTYALACVLYEMLTGEPPYQGNTAQAVLGKIISGAPVSATALRKSIPPNVDGAIRQALEKLPADRFTSTQGFAEALSDPTFRYGLEPSEAAGEAVRLWRRVALGAIAVAVGLGGVTASLLVETSAPDQRPTNRFSLRMDPEEALAPLGLIDLSRDGSFMVYQGVEVSGTRQVFLRRWSDPGPMPLAGSTIAGQFAISPDGSEVVYVENQTPRVIQVQGGLSRGLSGQAQCCVRWSRDGSWVYFRNREGGISRALADGGEAEVLTHVDPQAGDQSHVPGDETSGGRALLFEVEGTGDRDRIELLDLSTLETKTLRLGQAPRYLTSGHVAFSGPGVGRTIFVAALDERTMVLGSPIPMIEGHMAAGANPRMAVSDGGDLLYVGGDVSASIYTPVWVDRAGRVEVVDENWTFDPGENNRGLSLSPDGSHVAVSIVDPGPQEDVWIKELPDGPFSRLTTHEAQDVRPRWTPDGASVTFISERDGISAVVMARADGAGRPETVLEMDRGIWEAAVTEDGTILARTGGTLLAPGGRDIFASSGNEAPVQLVASDFDQKAIALSPDGRWLAYESDETGSNEVYVRPYPETDAGRWAVSTDGGVMPVWAHSSRELFYVDGRQNLVAARVNSSEGRFVVEGRETLFAIPAGILFSQLEQYALYDVSTDDERFLMLRSVGDVERTDEVILVQNWVGEVLSRLSN